MKRSPITHHDKPANIDHVPALQNYDEFLGTHPDVATVIDRAKLIDRSRRDLLQWAYTNGAYKTMEYDKVPARNNMPEYLGTGWEKAAYAVGDKFVAKVLNTGLDGKTITSFTRQVEDLEKGLGVPGLEQIVTADQDEGVIITELVKGRSIGTIPSHELAGRIKPHHLAKLQQTLEVMKERDLEYDTVDNVLFDPQDGFTIIDYRRVRNPSEDPGNRSTEDNYEDYLKEHSVEGFLAAVLPLRKRYSESFFNDYGDRETRFVKSAGRRIVTALVPKTKRS